MSLNRIVLVRHGETLGESSVRYHGSGDVALSAEGRAQARAAGASIRGEGFELVVASRLHRAWETATLIAPGRSIVLEAGFCEIDFGRWEGLTKEEIEARDPQLYHDWQSGPGDFDYPGGERRSEFRARVLDTLEGLLRTPYGSAIVVAHKGVVREIVSKLTSTELAAADPHLGAVLQVTRHADGRWQLGRRSSNPAALGDAPAAAEL